MLSNVFSFNINNVGTYVRCISKLIFLSEVAVVLSMSYLHVKQLIHFNYSRYKKLGQWIPCGKGEL